MDYHTKEALKIAAFLAATVLALIVAMPFLWVAIYAWVSFVLNMAGVP